MIKIEIDDDVELFNVNPLNNSPSRKGCIPWNKGKTNCQTAWNKNKKTGLAPGNKGKSKFASEEEKRLNKNKLLREHYNRNKDKIYKRIQEYKSKNIEWIREYDRNYKNEHYQEIAKKYKIERLLRSRLRRCIKNQNADHSSAIKNLGCSVEQFKKYIENLFTEGMTWDNHGEWHLDHIKPLAKFDLNDPKQVAEVCHYTNIQPLWAKDNLSKGCK